MYWQYIFETDTIKHGNAVLTFGCTKFQLSEGKETSASIFFLAVTNGLTLVIFNAMNGVSIGYTMAQFCLIIEITLGFLILKEHKQKNSIIGAVFIPAGCIMVYLVGYI